MTITRQWTGPGGIRYAEVDRPDLAGEIMVDKRDLAKWLTTLDPASSGDPVKREALVRFQREVVVLGPAAAHRRACALLEEFGLVLPECLKRPLVHVVKDASK